jgi:hypothetical protein
VRWCAVKPADCVADRKAVASKLLSLRRADVCSNCKCHLPEGTRAWWDSQARAVTCAGCLPGNSVPPPGFVAQPDPGKAGSSASREHRRRMERREARVREAHPKLAPLLLALSSPPQHESAFERGAEGERTVAAGLGWRVAEGSVRLLHDRRMPRGRGNIDHLAVAPTGVYVIDAKAHKGKVRIVRPVFGSEKLLINGRDWTKLLDGLDRQVTAVHQVLGGDSIGIPVHGVLCFTNADLPWLRTARMRGHLLMYGRALARKLNSDGPLTPVTIDALTRTLAAALPPA